MAKRNTIILGALLVVTNLTWIYIFFEQQVHLGYLASDVQSISSQKESFKEVCNHVYSDLNTTQAKSIAKKIHPSQTLFMKEGALHIGWYSINLNSQTTKTVEAPCAIW